MLKALYHLLMFVIVLAAIVFVGFILTALGVRHPERIVIGLGECWIVFSIVWFMTHLRRRVLR